MALTKPRAYQIYDIDYKQATRVITVANVTLSGGAPSQVDGVNLSLKDRVLVIGQTNKAQNGIYQVTTVGSGSNGTWARSGDTNSTGELLAGTIVMVTEGLIYADTQWKLVTDDPIVIGTSLLVFEQNSAFAFGNVFANGTAVLANSVGSTITLSAGNNISIVGNNTSKTVTIGVSGISLNSISNGTSNVNVVSSGGNVTVGIAGTSNVAVFSATGANITGTFGVSGNANVGNIGAVNAVFTNISGTLTTAAQTNITSVGTLGSLAVTGNISGGNLLTSGNIVDTGAISIITAASGNVNLAPNGTNTLVATTTGANITGTLNATGNANVGNLGATTVIATTLTGTLSTASQPNITSVGTLGSLTVTANVAGGNISTAGQVIATGNITGANLIVNNDAVITGNLTVNGTTTTINSNTITTNDKNIVVANNQSTGANVDGAGIDAGGGTPIATWRYNNATTSWQSNISITPSANATLSLGGASNYWGNAFLTTASVTGNVTSGNITTSGQVTATGNVTSGNITTSGQVIATGNISGGNITAAGQVTATGNIAGSNLNVTGNIVDTGALTLITGASGNVSLAPNGSTTVVATTAGANVIGALGVTGNVTGGNILGNGAGLTGINSFGTIAVNGQDNVVADNTSDTLTLTAGSGIAITTVAGTDTITIATVATDSIFATGGEMGTITETVTVSEDLGLITDTVTISYDLGTIVTSGIIAPDALFLPSKTVTELASLSASPAGQFVYCSNESGGAVPAFSDGTNWRRVTDRAIVS
jgi:hypothetical protein